MKLQQFRKLIREEITKVITEAENESNDEMQFAETRMGGAEKIVDNAKEKGGLSMLTWHHFKVKLPYYKKASTGKLDIEDAKKEYQELLEKLYSSTKEDVNIGQVAFQELLGKLEVLGELIINHD
jgi:hypothetical protein